MVLDTYEPDQDLFIFKNTYNDEASGQPKQFKIKRTDPNAPEELFFVHIRIRDMDNLPSQEQREAEKEAEIEKKEQQFKPEPHEEQILLPQEESALPDSNPRNFLYSLCCCFSGN